MTTAVLNDFNLSEIKQAQKGEISSSRFVTLAYSINRLALRVRKNWSKFSSEERSVLRELAYQLIDPPKGLTRIICEIQVTIHLLVLRVKGQERGFFMVLDSLDNLVDSIFDSIEREDAGYQQVLADTLGEVISDPSVGQQLKSEDVRGWLREISNRAVEEV